MKSIQFIHGNGGRTSFLRLAFNLIVVTLALLSIPLVAMQFTAEVNWSAGDFLIMGALLLITGIAIIGVSRLQNRRLELSLIAGVLILFFLSWAHLAVGIL